MAYFQGTVRSMVMEMDTNVNVIIPYDHFSKAGVPEKYDKTLYLLHGLKQNAQAWPRLSAVEQYANRYGFAVVMPEVQRSFYTDMAFGPRYFEFLTEELPKTLHELFRLPEGREHTYAGGLSMGGYGALKCALACPDKFCGAMCFSSGFYMLDTPEALQKAYYSKEELQGVVGLELKRGEKDDMEALMEKYPSSLPRPKLYLACGTEDPLLCVSDRMHEALEAHHFAHAYENWAGAHEWRFWDKALDKGMEYMNE